MSTYRVSEKSVDDVVKAYLDREIVPLMRDGQIRTRHLGVVVAVNADGRTFEQSVAVRLQVDIEEGLRVRPFIETAEDVCRLLYQRGGNQHAVLSLQPFRQPNGTLIFYGGFYYCGIAVGVCGLDTSLNNEVVAEQIATQIWQHAIKKTYV